LAALPSAHPSIPPGKISAGAVAALRLRFARTGRMLGATKQDVRE
jgi:hypothetical protein